MKMQYHGKLYGKIGEKYFDTGKTADDFDTMEKRISELTSCKHQWVRTTRNYKPAKKCYLCGEINEIRNKGILS